MDEEGIAIGANFGPGGEFEITARASKDENQPAIETGIVLVADGCPTAGTHNLAAPRAHPICIVHQAVTGRATVQFRQVKWGVGLGGGGAAFGLGLVIFLPPRDKLGTAMRAYLVFSRYLGVAE